jgi:hypothetical protein
MAKSTTLLLILVSISFFAKAQSAYKVTGLVRDAQGKPLAGVTVSLLKPPILHLKIHRHRCVG